MAHEFQMVVLAGGSGDRLHPLCENVAKPLLPIKNRPMLYYQASPHLPRVAYLSYMFGKSYLRLAPIKIRKRVEVANGGVVL